MLETVKPPRWLSEGLEGGGKRSQEEKLSLGYNDTEAMTVMVGAMS